LNLLRQRYAGTTTTTPNWRLIVATSLAGVRGAITLAGILTLPLLMPDGTPFPARATAIFLAAAVIVLSLIGASVGLPALLRGLKLPSEPAPQHTEMRARSAAAHAAMEAVRKTQHRIEQQTAAADADLCANAASRVIAVYQRRVHDDTSEETDADQLRKADAMERRLRLAGLQAERAEIHDLARKRRISDATSRRLVREIDLLESFFRR
jgi:CPA1 family monovalent cation:H+ antiporter